MHLLALDAETAKSASLVVVGSAVFAFLLVLKFVNSVITKLILMTFLIAIGVFSFTQRDALTACINKVTAQQQANVPIHTACEFFGRQVTISLPSG
ncbi:MAG: hypothetical protein ABIQ38_00985 [Ilumatobacteraceae bacterium]